MDGMPLVLIAVVIAAGIIAAITLILDLVERRNFERALRETRAHEPPLSAVSPGAAEREEAGSAR